MTRDDIIRMGVQARLIKGFTTKTPPAEHPVTSVQLVHEDLVLDALERFFEIAAAAEREACALVCEGYGRHQITQYLAYAIRSRGAAPVPAFDVSKPATDPVNAPAVQHIREHLLDAARKAATPSPRKP